MNSIITRLTIQLAHRAAEAAYAYLDAKIDQVKRSRESADETQRRHAVEDAKWRAEQLLRQDGR